MRATSRGARRSGFLVRGRRGELVAVAPGRLELAPRARVLCPPPKLVVARVRVQQIELNEGRGEPALLGTVPESRAAGRRGARDPHGRRSGPRRRRASGRRQRRGAPRRGSRPRAEARRSVSSSSSRASPRAGRARPRRRPRRRPAPRSRRPLAPSREPERLREDCLAGAGLTGDGVQPRAELEPASRGSGRSSRCAMSGAPPEDVVVARGIVDLGEVRAGSASPRPTTIESPGSSRGSRGRRRSRRRHRRASGSRS